MFFFVASPFKRILQKDVKSYLEVTLFIALEQIDTVLYTAIQTNIRFSGGVHEKQDRYFYISIIIQVNR